MKKTKLRFAIIGVAGYIAPKHLKAIQETGNDLVAALDVSDSVGILDSYFPKTSFFTSFERFDRFIEKQKRLGIGIDYLVVCSPNYLHDAHIRYGIRIGVPVICEKPLVLNPWNLEAITEMSKEFSIPVFNILQLRLHPAVIKLKEKYGIPISQIPQKVEIELTYITSRGPWYFASWKGDESKSGGIVMNIGVHFFDMLIDIFGQVIQTETHRYEYDRCCGYLELERAKIKWFLSINNDTIPKEEGNKRTFRQLKIGEEKFDFSTGFTNLHTLSYEKILNNKGFEASSVKAVLELIHNIRKMNPQIKNDSNVHQLACLPATRHPFDDETPNE